MKKKTIWSLALALALVVSAIGTATSAFAATSAPMEPVTKIATENEDAIWEQIEAVEKKSDAIFQRNAALWEKPVSYTHLDVYKRQSIYCSNLTK